MTGTTKVLVIVLAVLAAIVLVAPTMPGGAMGPGMMWGYGASYFGPWGWAWGLAFGLRAVTMLAFWGVIAVGIALLVRWLGGAGGSEDRR
jgi:small-conductance mechanosensitive channel